MMSRLSVEGHERLKVIVNETICTTGALIPDSKGAETEKERKPKAAAEHETSKITQPFKAVVTEETIKSLKEYDSARYDDGGLAVVRVKPLGAGGGGIEKSASSGKAGVKKTAKGIVVIGGPREKLFKWVSAAFIFCLYLACEQ